MHNKINAKPLVSILIPVYNRSEYIAETLSCAFSQSYDNIEIIVVDNASTDGTWEICKSLSENEPRIKIYRNAENVGPVNNWRKCISYASGEYAKILWSDDLISHDYIEKTLHLFNNDVGFVFTSVVIDDDFNKTDHVYYQYGDTGLYPSIRYLDEAMLDNKLPVSPGCAIFRLADLKKNLVNGVESPSFSDFSNHGAGPDLLMFLLTALHYPYIGFVNEPLSFFREHSGSISLSMKRLDLYDRYQQAKIWFCAKYLSHDVQRRLSSITWVQRAMITKKLSMFSSINLIYGEGIAAPSTYSVIFFVILKIYQRMGF